MAAVPLSDRDVELVVVAYRSRPQVEALLAGLPDDLPIVVVDNSDGSDGLGDALAARPTARYLRGGGVGFARAANLGARTSSAEFLVFVNPDMRPTADHLAEVVQDVADDPTCAASAATRVDEEGVPQMNGGWEPSVRRSLVHAVGAHKAFPRAGLFATPEAGEDLPVDWVSGAVMAVRRETFLRLGCFDEMFYVYCEDVAFSRAAREHGMRVRLRTDVLVPGAAAGSGAPSLEMSRLRGAFQTRYARTRNSRLPALGIVAANVAGYAVRAVRERRRGDVDLAEAYRAYVKGAVTGEATVSGRLVTGRGRKAPQPAAASAPGEIRYGAVVLTQGNRPDELKAAVESLLRQRGVTVDVAVVGNGWEPTGLPPEVTCLGLPENVGIPSGRNAGVPLVSGEYLFFLDDDEVLPDDGLLAEAAQRMIADPRIGMIQPRIDVLGGGEAPRRWTPRSRVGDRTRSGMAFMVLEGALALRRDVFEAAGGWAPEYWYAHEGTDLAWKIWDTGHRVVYMGDLVAEHPFTVDTRHVGYHRMSARNRVLLARRNLPVVLGVVYVLSWTALESVRWCRYPSSVWAYFRGTWEGLSVPVERRPLRWRTIATMTRYGRPPVW